MAQQRTIISFELDPQLLKLIEQRAKQEGITRSEFLRECVYFEFMLSGDLEASRYIARRVGARVRDVMRDRFQRWNPKQTAEVLAGAQG